MKLVIKTQDGQLVTTSEAIAQGTDTQHKNVLELVREYQIQLETLGGVAFETRPFKTNGGIQQREIALLTEPQSTFLLTLMRNSEIVVKFKLALVKAFYELKSGTAAGGAAKFDIAPKLFPAFFRVARLIGCDRNSAAVSANNAVFQATGTNILALLGQTHMEAEKQELVFNVSDLADGISGVKMNRLIESAGLQTRSGERWVPTHEGMKFCRIFDTGKRHGNGTPVQQIKWGRDVLDLLSLTETA